MEEIDFGSWKPSLGPPSTLGEVYDSSLDSQRKVQNVNAYTRGLMEAYDRVNDEVKKSVGAELINPFNRFRGPSGDAMGAPGGSVYDNEPWMKAHDDPVKAWEKDLDDLAGKHPDAFDWATLKSRPIAEVAKLMKAAEDKQSDVSQRRGFIDPKEIPGIGRAPLVRDVVGGAANIIKDPAGMAASFAGSLRGSLESPVDLLANVVGGVAGSASKSLVKNAIRNGLANAGVQAVLEPVVQGNRAAGGLEYGWEKAFEDIAGAFGTGAALDLAVRPAGRAAIKRFGTDTPDGTFSRNVERGGIIFDAPEQLPLPPLRARTPDLSPELIERARNDDVAALREIAEKTGIMDQPGVKGALDYAELGGKIDEAAIARFKQMDVDTGEGMRILGEAMRDPDRYLRMPEPIRQADAPLMREEAQALLTAQTEKVSALVDGLGPQLGQVVTRALEAGLPQIVPLVREALGNPEAATRLAAQIGDGAALADAVTIHTSNNLLDVVDAMRRSPDAMDSNVPISTDFMTGARALAALDPDAYALVRGGEVAPAIAAEVANLVPLEQQARMLADLRKAGVQTAAQARQMISDILPNARAADEMPLSGGSRIDDPAGPEAKAQTDRLREEHSEALKEATAPIKERDKVEDEVETIRGEIAKLEEKVAKTTFDDVGDTFNAPAAERFVDPFDQAPIPKADVDAIVDMWRYVREQNAIADPVSLTEFVRRKGGLKEDAGELKNMLGDYNKRPGLVSKKGMFLDDMTLDAWEAGYLPGTERPEIKALLDALDNDLRGERVYSELDADTVANKAAAVEMLRDLEEMGIRDARSEASVRKHFEGEGDSGAQGGQGAAGEKNVFAELAQKRDALRAAESRLAELNNDLIPGDYSPMFAFLAERIEMQRARDVSIAVNDALRLADTILPEQARVTVTAERLDVDGVALDAMERAGDITLALHALDPAARLGHEGVHALVSRGHLSPQEVDLLAQAGRETKAFSPEIEARYREAYADRPNLERQIAEEAAAHFVEAKIKSPAPEVQTIADRVRALIQRVKNALDGYGFKTADDVRSAILRGDVAKRQARDAWMRTNPEVVPGVTPLARGTSEPPVSGYPTLRNTTMYAIKAFHGSPHDFDRFDLSRIGTGEGAQAYGHGLYFAENEGVAKSYREGLSKMSPSIDGKPVLEAYADGSLPNVIAEKIGIPRSEAIGAANILSESVRTGRPVGEILGEKIAREKALYRASTTEAWAQQLEAIAPASSSGRLYEVKINAESEQFLDWDKPLSQQSEKVRDGVRQAIIDRGLPKAIADRLSTADDIPAMNAIATLARGEYNLRLNVPDGERAARASQALRDAGVPGIRYLDQGSRGDGQGTYNYVVFDDKLIEITAKDGVPMSAKDKSDVMFALRDGGRQDPLGYTSRALDAARGLKQAKGTPEQMLAQLKAAGVRQAEMDATGLSDAFDGQKTITRDAIVQHLEANRVELKEVQYGDPNGAEIAALTKELNLQRTSPRDKQDPQRIAELESMIDDLIDPDAQDTKWSAHSLDPSNPTYRETVLHLPLSKMARLHVEEMAPFGPDGSGEAMWQGRTLVRGVTEAPFEMGNQWGRITHWPSTYNHMDADQGERFIVNSPNMQNANFKTFDEARRAIEASYHNQPGTAGNDMAKARQDVFRSGHFPEPNIVGHLMTSTVKDAQGRPVYLIDQIQSDWGQRIESDTREALAQRLFGKGFKTLSPDERKQVSAAKQEGDKSAGVRDEAKIAELKAKVAEVDPDETISAYRIAEGEMQDKYGGARWMSEMTPTEAARMQDLGKAMQAVTDRNRMLTAELRTAEATSPGHPLVNTTDQWTNTTLRRAIRQAAEQDAHSIAIPSGDTVLTYNPGDTEGMRGFYDKIVPKNLRNLLQKIDKASPAPERVDTLDTPTKGEQGKGFTVFPLSDAVKRSVLDEGQPMFALRADDPEPPKPPLHSEVAMLDRLSKLKDLAMHCKG